MGEKREPLLTAEEKEKIVKAIGEAERQTSGEIRLRVERLCAEDVLDGTSLSALWHDGVWSFSHLQGSWP